MISDPEQDFLYKINANERYNEMQKEAMNSTCLTHSTCIAKRTNYSHAPQHVSEKSSFPASMPSDSRPSGSQSAPPPNLNMSLS